MIALGRTAGKGRGVFAQKEFAAGETIERSPVLVVPDREWTMIEPTVLYGYTFSWGENLEHAALAMGLGSFYNHSWSANAEYLRRPEDEIIEFVALRAISAGEEITVNYNGQGDESPLWFTVLP